MKVYVVFKTKNMGAHWTDEVHCVKETEEEAKSALVELPGGYISDYDTK